MRNLLTSKTSPHSSLQRVDLTQQAETNYRFLPPASTIHQGDGSKAGGVCMKMMGSIGGQWPTPQAEPSDYSNIYICMYVCMYVVTICINVIIREVIGFRIVETSSRSEGKFVLPVRSVRRRCVLTYPHTHSLTLSYTYIYIHTYIHTDTEKQKIQKVQTCFVPERYFEVRHTLPGFLKYYFYILS